MTSVALPPRFPCTDIADLPQVFTAAALCIGDEILSGKTKDTNSNYLARKLFDLGISLKKIEVIADDEAEIIEASKRLTNCYDLVISSGGIGPTHDDITYSSLAKAFDPEGTLEYHEETLRRMDAHIKHRFANSPDFKTPTEEATIARKRMALFPKKGAEVLFVSEELWVPVVRLQHKLCILPGIPKLFESLVDGLLNYIRLPPAEMRPFRVLVHTKMPEAAIAPFISKLAQQVKSENVRIGSYPKFSTGVDVSLIGQDHKRLHEIALDVAHELEGEVLT